MPTLANKNISSIGLAVEYYRNRKRWTQGQLATYSGIAQSYISKLESGKSTGNLRKSTVEKLARTLEIETHDLLYYAPNNEQRFTLTKTPNGYTVDERRAKLIAKLSQLDAAALDAIENLLDLITKGRE
jgi:transcriptional regulator with XRE-family HTH domain